MVVWSGQTHVHPCFRLGSKQQKTKNRKKIRGRYVIEVILLAEKADFEINQG